MKTLTLLFSLIATTATAQFGVSVSPYSFDLWGSVDGYTQVSAGWESDITIEYGFFRINPVNVQVNYFHPKDERYWYKAVKKGEHPDAVPKEKTKFTKGEDHFFKKYPPEKYEYLYSGYTRKNISVSYMPLDIGQIIKAGAMISARGFPTDKSVRFNFIIDVGYTFNRFRISYNHISNGFGIQHPINFGYDNAKITYYF